MCVCGFLKFIGLFFIASSAKVREEVKSECPEASLPAENFTFPSSVTILLTLAKSWIIYSLNSVLNSRVWSNILALTASYIGVLLDPVNCSPHSFEDTVLQICSATALPMPPSSMKPA